MVRYRPATAVELWEVWAYARPRPSWVPAMVWIV